MNSCDGVFRKYIAKYHDNLQYWIWREKFQIFSILTHSNFILFIPSFQVNFNGYYSVLILSVSVKCTGCRLVLTTLCILNKLVLCNKNRSTVHQVYLMGWRRKGAANIRKILKTMNVWWFSLKEWQWLHFKFFFHLNTVYYTKSKEGTEKARSFTWSCFSIWQQLYN
mgnify:CR=1 FL=1